MIDILTGTAFDAPKRMHHREDGPALEFPYSASSRRRNLLALRGMMWGAAKQSGPTARDYVQDGLIAMWDGIENAGWGVHDGSASKWTDLVSSNEIQLYGSAFSDNSLVCGGQSVGGYNDDLRIVCGHIELCATANARRGRIWIASTGQSISNKYSGFVGWYDRGLAFGLYDSTDEIVIGNRYTFSFSPGLPTVALDGETKTLQTMTDLTPQEARGLGMVVGGQKNSPLACEVFCIRLYSRALTASEIEANYAVDKARFGLT